VEEPPARSLEPGAGAPTSLLTTALQATVLRAPSVVGFDSHFLRVSNGELEGGGRMMLRNEKDKVEKRGYIFLQHKQQLWRDQLYSRQTDSPPQARNTSKAALALALHSCLVNGSSVMLDTLSTNSG
jgi:hypothetical protein